MIEQLFGSKTRVKLLRLFLTDVRQSYFVRQITRITDEHINSVRRELIHLEKIDLVTSFDEDRKKYYKVNTKALFYPELKAMVIKAKFSGQEDFITELLRSGKIYFMALSGIFVDLKDAPTDIILIGDVRKDVLQRALELFQSNFEREIYYTIFSKDEFDYRKDIDDRFLKSILNAKKTVVIDNLPEPWVNLSVEN